MVLQKSTRALLASYASDNEHFLSETQYFLPRKELYNEISLLFEIFFPHYFNCESTFDSVLAKLAEFEALLLKALLYESQEPSLITQELFDKLPSIREMLKKDIHAAFQGDPAATSYVEIIRSYPGFKAILVQRFAHALYTLGIRTYARELTEYAHSSTGIDIHPGTKIGSSFFIDHGTGVVIGETCEIGNWVRIYQQVTLGALHFKKDPHGNLSKGYKRHPTLKDNVVIGAGAKILGPVTLGARVNVGANAWITEDIDDDSTVYIAQHPELIVRKR